jgi:hypothetical protein
MEYHLWNKAQNPSLVEIYRHYCGDAVCTNV